MGVCGRSRRSSRSGSCAGVSTVLGHDTGIPCLSPLLHLLGSRTRDRSLLGFSVFITRASVCNQVESSSERLPGGDFPNLLATEVGG